MSEERRQRIIAHWQVPEREAEGAWAQKRRLAAAMRVVIDRLMQTKAPEDELRAAADRLERYAEHLDTLPRGIRYAGFAESANAGDVGAFFDQSPVIGRANPLAPPVMMAATEDERIEGQVTFGAAYEGPPGHVHGGWIACAYDEVLGFAQSLTGNPGMTGTLTIRYRRPTPLGVELRFEAWVDRVEGRKIFAAGKLMAGNAVTAEAEGIFVSVGIERMRQLVEERDGAEDA